MTVLAGPASPARGQPAPHNTAVHQGLAARHESFPCSVRGRASASSLLRRRGTSSSRWRGCSSGVLSAWRRARRCRHRVQQAIHGHRSHLGHKGDPLYSARRALHTDAGLVTDNQAARLAALFDDDEHVEGEATWGIFHRMVGAYGHEDRRQGRELMATLIDSISPRRPRRFSLVLPTRFLPSLHVRPGLESPGSGGNR